MLWKRSSGLARSFSSESFTKSGSLSSLMHEAFVSEARRVPMTRIWKLMKPNLRSLMMDKCCFAVSSNVLGRS